MEWLNSLQSVPVIGVLFAFVFLFLTSFANGWKEKREGKKLGIEQERQRQEAAAAAKDQAIIERSEHVKDTADAVRDPSNYGDERMRDEADPLPGYHYRD